MKQLMILAVGLLSITTITAQVGIGTLTPNSKSVLELSSNSKGLLLPRMTSGERTAMALTASDAGMMVFQTSSPKGMYTWDGAGWIYSAPIDAGAVSSTTLRWDVTNSKWIAASNIYNGGGSIGINTGSAPNYQLQMSSPFSNTRLQLTSSTFGTTSGDGLILGINNNVVSSTAGLAYLLNQESKPLWFGTWGLERMRIDSAGHVGINTMSPNQLLHINGNAELPGQLQITNLATAALPTDGLLLGCTTQGSAQLMQQENKSLTFGTNGLERVRIDSVGRVGINNSNPASTLDVNGTLNVTGAVVLNGAVNTNGTMKIGSAGTVLQNIIRADVSIDPPSMAFMGEWTASVSFSGATSNATVYVSPGSAMDHMLIAYSMVSTPNFIDIKLMNMGPTADMGPVILHVVVIQ